MASIKILNIFPLPLADVTDTYFKFAGGNGAYNDPGTFIAYIFAGGESTAATARSVEFDGSGDYLSIPDHVYPGDGDSNGNFEFWSNGTLQHYIKSYYSNTLINHNWSRG